MADQNTQRSQHQTNPSSSLKLQGQRNSMENIIKIVGSDDYEYNIDEIESIVIKNKLGMRFEFKLNEIKSMTLITNQDN